MITPTLTLEQAQAILRLAPNSDKPSRFNPSLTEAQAVKIMTDGLTERNLRHDIIIHNILKGACNSRKPSTQRLARLLREAGVQS
jgi:hypothetical protein